MNRKKKETPGNSQNGSVPEALIPQLTLEGEKPERTTFPIVGVGASAGGLGAFEAFFSGMPADVDPGMAFVLVQHLAPDHKSILTELIRRYTRMDVFEVEDGMIVRPNCTYIIPPNHDMAFLDGALRLLEPVEPRGRRLPIDFFFRSLAEDQGERAIGVVLSGTGSDGTLGVRSIKGMGGMVMVQARESTEFDGMPSNAIATGLVDYELPPSEMPAQIISYVSRALTKDVHQKSGATVRTEAAIKKIFVLLRAQTGHDFSQYKPSTIHRRIERRMAVVQTDSTDAYVAFLKRTPSEVEALFRDLLIGVTNFFRDPGAFQALEKIVIPELFAGKPRGSAIRVWCAGCSTGEEPYSVAILIQERLDAAKQAYKVQVFATDIDSQAIATARAGLYPPSIAADMTPDRLARFFTLEPGGDAYRIHKEIRDMMVFSEQNVISDPPFSKVDLVTCRNLLIYMGTGLHKRLIPLFHYSLNPGGFLFLGSSESIGEFGDLFLARDRHAKLYQRKADTRRVHRAGFTQVLPIAGERRSGKAGPTAHLRHTEKVTLRDLTESAIVTQIAPGGALINSRGDILYLHGRTGLYLEPAPGDAGVSNILKMAREGLRRELTTALRKAVRTGEIVRSPGLLVKSNGHFTTVNLTICPVATDLETTARGGPTAAPGSPLFLVILEDTPALPEHEEGTIKALASKSSVDAKTDAESMVAALQQELRANDQFLQSATEELETANEELKSSNEEMQSINEEMQSTNEELETSKEELQSVNEELATVNNELQTKVADLSRANNDMNNLLAGTDIGTVFVDHALRIVRFTPAITRIINLIQSDVKRPVGHIVSNLAGYDKLVEDVQGVLDTLVPRDIDVRTKTGVWYSMRILPYRTLDNVIEGAVITFVDISQSKAAEEKIANLLKEKDLILKEVHHRIKNNMSTMMSMLSLQSNTISDPIATAALRDAKGRIQSMMLLYDKLYRSADFQEVSIKEYLSSLVDDIARNFPGGRSIRIEKRLADFQIRAQILFSFGIIINELLTNILKYAFVDRDDGLVTISASVNGDLATIVVEDNGNGLPDTVDFENSTGFGLMLVGMLAKQIGGKISVSRENGTKITIQFDK